VKYGVMTFPTEYAIHPAELARGIEERGLESLWVAEHSHIPASRRSPWPGGGELPQMYYDALDPFVALSAAAQATERIKLATGICLVVQRDPIQTAKAVASLDVLSKGRFLFGIGGGWNREEMANHGTAFEGRWKLLRERIEAMKAIWTQERAEYHGEYVSFDPIVANPKPRQKPHPPIHVGGAFPGGMRRALRYGDGWIPLAGRGDDDVVAHLPALREQAAAAGRDPAALEVSVYACPPDKDVLQRYRDAGIHRVVLGAPPADRDTVLGILDRIASLAEAVG
jgi:probable F420-dependent oxidoreductase